MRVGAQLCLQKCPFFSPHSLASFRDIPPFNVLSSLYSKILRIGFSHISSNEDFHRLRLQVFQAPEGIQFPGRCLVYGGGRKMVNTLWLKQWKMSPIRFSDIRIMAFFHRHTQHSPWTQTFFSPNPCTFHQAHTVNHDLHRCYPIGQLRSSVVNQ